MKMIRAYAAALAGMALLAGAPGVASAASIDGEIAFFGIFEATGGSGLGDATGLSFPNPVLIAAGTGDFAGLAGSNSTWSDLTFDPPTGGLLWSSGGYSFTLLSVQVDFQTANALDLSGTGIYSAPGFDDTPGTFAWTGDSAGGILTFSSTGAAEAAVIPVPGALLLLASAIGGLGFARGRKSS